MISGYRPGPMEMIKGKITYPKTWGYEGKWVCLYLRGVIIKGKVVDWDELTVRLEAPQIPLILAGIQPMSPDHWIDVNTESIDLAWLDPMRFPDNADAT